MVTTIQISERTRAELEKRKIHRREPLDEVILKLLGNSAEKVKPNDLEAIKRIAMPILKKNSVEKAAVFGSFARGDATESSDIDLLVKYREHTSLFDVARLKKALEDATDRKVDLVSYEWIDEHIKERVMRERIPLYE